VLGIRPVFLCNMASVQFVQFVDYLHDFLGIVSAEIAFEALY